MDNSIDNPLISCASHQLEHDGVAILRWFGYYGLFLAACVAALWAMMLSAGWTWHNVYRLFAEMFHTPLAVRAAPPDPLVVQAIKVLLVITYLSACTTASPMPTGWIVAGMATQSVAIGPNVCVVTLIVGLAGAMGSMIANLNDYHIFTWLLRTRHVAKIRGARWYGVAAKWYGRSPFWILTFFTFIPIPVDVIRLLAITYRYSRVRFAAASFLGRFLRYGLFAFVTYRFEWWWMPWALLGFAAVVCILKGLQMIWRRLNRPAASGT